MSLKHAGKQTIPVIHILPCPHDKSQPIWAWAGDGYGRWRWSRQVGWWAGGQVGRRWRGRVCAHLWVLRVRLHACLLGIDMLVGCGEIVSLSHLVETKQWVRESTFSFSFWATDLLYASANGRTRLQHLQILTSIILSTQSVDNKILHQNSNPNPNPDLKPSPNTKAILIIDSN